MRWIYRVIYLIVTGLLGGACLGRLNPVVEYGCPHARYRLDGKVLRDVSGEPVSGIRVSFLGYPDTSQVDGAWAIHAEGGVLEGHNIIIRLEPRDGEDREK